MGLTVNGNERLPYEMLPYETVVKIASGADHLVMLTNQGYIYTCGCAEQGQLGRVAQRNSDRHSSRIGISEFYSIFKIGFYIFVVLSNFNIISNIKIHPVLLPINVKTDLTIVYNR